MHPYLFDPNQTRRYRHRLHRPGSQAYLTGCNPFSIHQRWQRLELRARRAKGERTIGAYHPLQWTMMIRKGEEKSSAVALLATRKRMIFTAATPASLAPHPEAGES